MDFRVEKRILLPACAYNKITMEHAAEDENFIGFEDTAWWLSLQMAQTFYHCFQSENIFIFNLQFYIFKKNFKEFVCSYMHS